jgi:hypothetical protein
MGNLILSTQLTLDGVITVIKFCQQLSCCWQNLLTGVLLWWRCGRKDVS